MRLSFKNYLNKVSIAQQEWHLFFLRYFLLDLNYFNKIKLWDIKVSTNLSLVMNPKHIQYFWFSNWYSTQSINQSVSDCLWIYKNVGNINILNLVLFCCSKYCNQLILDSIAYTSELEKLRFLRRPILMLLFRRYRELETELRWSWYFFIFT